MLYQDLLAKTDTYQLLVIILSITLTVFLIVLTIALFFVISLVRKLNRQAAKVEAATKNIASITKMFRPENIISLAQIFLKKRSNRK